MVLAGTKVTDRLVLTLARVLRDVELYDTADRLERACNDQIDFLPLTILERDEILSVLTECPPGLGELRADLLREVTWPNLASAAREPCDARGVT